MFDSYKVTATRLQMRQQEDESIDNIQRHQQSSNVHFNPVARDKTYNHTSQEE